MIYDGKLTDAERQKRDMGPWDGITNVALDETGRIVAASDDFDCGGDTIKIKLPAGLPAGRAVEYRVENGKAIHDALPPEEESGEPSIQELMDILLGVEP